MRSVYLLIGLSLLVLSGAAWFAYMALHITDEASGAAQFIAASGILSASAGWIFNNAATLRLKLREQALSYLQTATERIVLQERAAHLNQAWLELKMEDMLQQEGAIVDFWRENFPSHEIFSDFRILANSYEQMGIAIKYRAVEERMLRAYFATSLLWFHSRLAPFLPLYRNDPPLPGNPVGSHQNPKLFSYCEWLAVRWYGREE